MTSNDNALEPVRFSRLKRLGKSPAHYACPQEDSAALRKGGGLHAYLLGQRHTIAVYEDGKRDGRSKAFQAFQAANEGKRILIPSELAPVEGMRAAIEMHPRAMALLGGIQEQTITWDLGGRACQGTPDVVHVRADGSKTLVELKTTRSSAPELFKWDAKRLAYHAQMDWYSHGLESTIRYQPGPVTEHFIVAVESAPPHPVTVLRVCPSMLERGRRQWRLWFETLRVCEASRRFPGYVEADVDWEDEEQEGDGLDWGDDGEEAA